MPLNECAQCGKFNLPDVPCHCSPSSAMRIKGKKILSAQTFFQHNFSGEWIVDKITKRIGETIVTFARGSCKLEKINTKDVKLKVGTKVIIYGWISGESAKTLVLARHVSTAAGPHLNF